MTNATQDNAKSQLDKFREAAREPKAEDGPPRFKERLAKVVKI